MSRFGSTAPTLVTLEGPSGDLRIAVRPGCVLKSSSCGETGVSWTTDSQWLCDWNSRMQDDFQENSGLGFMTCNKYQMSGRQTPREFLKQLIGKPVMVKLNSGLDYRGILACLDGYLNVALEQTEEYVNGQLKQKYGDAFIRGNNVLYISTQKRRA
ncbi:U6 snRNA-associated Sm-like protein LSm6 [Trichinella pseudospiralis]|uniref:U6 snRNA-associated Sm-like protein LSm6 n=1 Tax=Trichinella pseudospiralis TaxID=6337 RepID=A0A0V1EZ70_TRIPS|nr:U6 snRNA-associated Sm-like protein LSm6 [Trichinella pseudospiralis]